MLRSGGCSSTRPGETMKRSASRRLSNVSAVSVTKLQSSMPSRASRLERGERHAVAGALEAARPAREGMRREREPARRADGAQVLRRLELALSISVSTPNARQWSRRGGETSSPTSSSTPSCQPSSPSRLAASVSWSVSITTSTPARRPALTIWRTRAGPVRVDGMEVDHAGQVVHRAQRYPGLCPSIGLKPWPIPTATEPARAAGRLRDARDLPPRRAPVALRRGTAALLAEGAAGEPAAARGRPRASRLRTSRTSPPGWRPTSPRARSPTRPRAC